MGPTDLHRARHARHAALHRMSLDRSSQRCGRRDPVSHYTVMACTVMAYAVMAYIVVAYTGMAYAVMAYIVTATNGPRAHVEANAYTHVCPAMANGPQGVWARRVLRRGRKRDRLTLLRVPGEHYVGPTLLRAHSTWGQQYLGPTVPRANTTYGQHYSGPTLHRPTLLRAITP